MNPLVFSEEVATARKSGAPIVALESTVISHGLPYPLNAETALRLECDLRDHGVVPATIAVLEGSIHIGLSGDQIEFLARGSDVMKLSRADLPMAVAQGKTGATTVAGTMICAHRTGIEIFATGGIGGVHRGAESSFDISADLHELALTPVSVVASGAKAILDLRKTLEVLETMGVPVITVEQDLFPAFWSRSSGLKAPLRVDEPAEIALIHRTRSELGLSGGQLIANPIPAEDEIPYPEMQVAIEAALADASRQGIVGKEVTPFLLNRILELTSGRSLAANIALLRSNAKFAAKVANELHRLPV